MRILVHPVEPQVVFLLTPYDMAQNYHSIQDFLFLMEWQADSILRDKVLSYNNIRNMSLHTSPFSPNTEVRMAFATRDSMLTYLKGEVPTGKAGELAELNAQLKEFFDARDREATAEGSSS